MTDRSGECWTCGHPGLRPEGHAEWCERVAALVLPTMRYPARHGTQYMYNAKACRCEACREAAAAYSATRRAGYIQPCVKCGGEKPRGYGRRYCDSCRLLPTTASSDPSRASAAPVDGSEHGMVGPHGDSSAAGGAGEGPTRAATAGRSGGNRPTIPTTRRRVPAATGTLQDHAG